MRIILYEPDETIGKSIVAGLEKAGLDVNWNKDFHSARNGIEREHYNVSVVDIDMDKFGHGLDLIRQWFSQNSKALCVSLYRKENTENGFKASRLGSQELYEIRSGNVAGLAHIIQNYEIHVAMPQIYPHSNVIFTKCITDLRGFINHQKPVLIVGESGCGKSYLAEHVLNETTNEDFPYEETRCGDLAGSDAIEKFLGIARNSRPDVKQHRKGILDRANEKGLLYLEQIQNLSPDLQDVLATTLSTGKFRPCGGFDSKPFTAHFIASCEDISQIDTSKFNRKLYTIISHNIISVPPLRDSQPDIIPTAEQIITEYCIRNSVSPQPVLSTEAKIKLYSHSWPGNYLELRHSVENAIVRCTNGEISERDLMITPTKAEGKLPTTKKELLHFTLLKHRGNKSEVSKELDISRPTLDAWLEEAELNYRDYKPKSKYRKK